MRKGGAKVVVIGKIYSNGCGHCQAMAQAWDKMKGKLDSNKFDVWDIEASEEPVKRIEFKQKHNIDLVSNGYPTIFKIIDGKQIDYNGERDVDSLLTWAETQ